MCSTFTHESMGLGFDPSIGHFTKCLLTSSTFSFGLVNVGLGIYVSGEVVTFYLIGHDLSKLVLYFTLTE